MQIQFISTRIGHIEWKTNHSIIMEVRRICFSGLNTIQQPALLYFKKRHREDQCWVAMNWNKRRNHDLLVFESFLPQWYTIYHLFLRVLLLSIWIDGVFFLSSQGKILSVFQPLYRNSSLLLFLQVKHGAN